MCLKPSCRGWLAGWLANRRPPSSRPAAALLAGPLLNDCRSSTGYLLLHARSLLHLRVASVGVLSANSGLLVIYFGARSSEIAQLSNQFARQAANCCAYRTQQDSDGAQLSIRRRLHLGDLIARHCATQTRIERCGGLTDGAAVDQAGDLKAANKCCSSS